MPLDMQVNFCVSYRSRNLNGSAAESRRKWTSVLAATNRDLEEMVKQKTFRQDLYYRLMISPVHIPPLRERPMTFCRWRSSFYRP
ncbi:MAG: sigma 54-interacting transcriptional regulator [Clostridium sp.]